MICNETDIYKDCKEEPSLIFKLIKEEYFDLVDKILSKKKVSLNTLDSKGNNVVTALLKEKSFDLVLKYMKDKTWDVNHQNNDGNTFAHYLVSINYVYVVDIIKSLHRRKDFIPNIKNKKGESILDKSINENYIFTTLKVLDDKRFDSIDVVAFKKMYNAYIKNSCYGKYSKINNLEIIVDSIDKKDRLLPSVAYLIELIKENMEKIKNEIMKNKSVLLDNIINSALKAAV